MKIELITGHDLTPRQLATALANGTPEDFAEVWFVFGELMQNRSLDTYAEAMAPSLGSRRKNIFREFERLISFHEERLKRKPCNQQAE